MAKRFVVILLATLVAAPVYAADTAVPDPSTLDIAGVKIGMTVDEAMSALKSFDDKYKITKLYSTEDFEQSGAAWPMERLSQSNKAIAFFSKLEAKHEATSVPCNQSAGGDVSRTLTASMMGMGDTCEKFKDDEETVTVLFSPVPGQERVTGVLREKTVHLEPPPTVDSVEHGLFEKYAGFTPTFSGNNKYSHQPMFVLLFDGKKRLLSLDSAKSLGAHDQYYCVDCPQVSPANVGRGEGISLRVILDPRGKSGVDAKLLRQVSMGLWDGDALMKGISQSVATFKALKTAANQKELDKSAASPSKTKF